MAKQSILYQREGMSHVQDLSQQLFRALEALQQGGIAAFVTRYPNSDPASEGTVIGLNQIFLRECNDQRAENFLGRTYTQIHGAEKAAPYQAAEHLLMSAPGDHQRIDEGPGVEVVKVALTADSTAVGVIADNQIYILGYFRISPGSGATGALSVEMQTAQESLRFLTGT